MQLDNLELNSLVRPVLTGLVAVAFPPRSEGCVRSELSLVGAQGELAPEHRRSRDTECVRYPLDTLASNEGEHSHGRLETHGSVRLSTVEDSTFATTARARSAL